MKRKENTFYAAVGIAVIVHLVASLFGAEAITLLPILLGVAFVGFWAFEVK